MIYVFVNSNICNDVAWKTDTFENAFTDLLHDKALKIVDLQAISDTLGTRL